MGLLSGKTALIFGVANDHSIAWGIAQAFAREGARLGFTYASPALEKRVRPLAASLRSPFVEPCDVASDMQIAAAMKKAGETFGAIDILIHSIGFARKEELTGPYYNTTREGFHLAMDISVYSFTALARAAIPILNPGGALLTLTYYGSEKVAAHYNVMGVAKAALESSVRYLASDLGPRRIRVNAISAGPIRTLAAAGISGFKEMRSHFRGIAPLRRHVTIEDVGNAAAFLCSDSAGAITGEVLYVDSGFNILGVPSPEESADG
ncbi:MAG: enoyl-ACP reductase [Anaerolineales bacterium]|nr:enoyl-ACP reductase [Anaerolineales bacterium]